MIADGTATFHGTNVEAEGLNLMIETDEIFLQCSNIKEEHFWNVIQITLSQLERMKKLKRLTNKTLIRFIEHNENFWPEP